LKLLKLLYTIFLGYKEGKKLKNVYVPKTYKETYITRLSKFDVYDRKFLLLISLFVIYKYMPQSFESFISKLELEMEDRNEYFKFKDMLQYPYKYIKNDIEYLLENHIEIKKEKILSLYQNKKISFYTFYMLLKDKEVGFVCKEIIKTINYILQFLKFKIDESWFLTILIEDDNLF